MAQIKFWDGMTQATQLELIDKFMVGVNADGSTKYANIQQLRAIVAAATQAPQAVSTSFDFDGAPEGIYVPEEDGTYDGVEVDLSEGYTQLVWDGSTLTKVVVPIDLAGYVAKTDFSTKGLLTGATIEDGSVNSLGNYSTTSGAKRVRNLLLAPGDYVLDGVEANAIKYFSFRNSSDQHTGTVQNLGTVPFSFTIPTSGVAGISFTIKAPAEPNDDSITNASLRPKSADGNGITLEYDGRKVITDALASGNYVPHPTGQDSAVSKGWVEENAMTYPQPVRLEQDDVSNITTPDWTWDIIGGSVSVDDISGIWDAILFDGVTDKIQFTVQHNRVWVVLGYSSATQICAVGVAVTPNIFGQVVNIDLTADTFTVIRTGTKSPLAIGQTGRIEIQSGNILMYKEGVLTETIAIASLTGAYLANINLGLAGANFSSSIANGSTLASAVSRFQTVPLTSKISQIAPDTSGIKMFVLGDSISTSSYGGLVDGQIWWQLVRDKIGSSATANAVSGTPIAEKSGFNSFVTDARWQAADLDTDIYIIEGGINDFGAREIPLGVMGSTDKTDFYGALRYLFTGVAARYPRAKIFYMTPLHTYNYGFPATNGTTGFTLQQYVDAARQTCDMVGVTLIDTYQKSGITYQNMNPSDAIYTTDGLHPNVAGHIRMAELVRREIELHF